MAEYWVQKGWKLNWYAHKHLHVHWPGLATRLVFTQSGQRRGLSVELQGDLKENVYVTLLIKWEARREAA